MSSPKCRLEKRSVTLQNISFPSQSLESPTCPFSAHHSRPSKSPRVSVSSISVWISVVGVEMLNVMAALLAFQLPLRGSAPSTLRSTSIRAVASPLDVVAAPLRKFEASTVTSGNILSDLPVEVILLFGAIVLVGIAGLIKTNSGLGGNAPTVGLGESREELIEKARKAQEELANMSQADKEKKYFKKISEDLAKKRGGSKKSRK